MTRRIRLLQIVDSLHAGGMENVAVQVMNRLDPERFEVTVCCLTTEGPFAERLLPAVRKVALAKEPGFQWGAVRQLRALMKEGFDVVHTHHLGGLIYTVLARAGLRKRGGRATAEQAKACTPTAEQAVAEPRSEPCTPTAEQAKACTPTSECTPTWRRPRIVHSEHIILHGWELDWKRHWQRWLLYRFADRVFTVSAQQLQQLQNHGLRHHTMFTLHNGVDCQRFCSPSETKADLRRRLGLDPDGFWVGKVGRFATAKRHVDLIDAFEQAAAREPALRLLLLGDGGIEKEKVLAKMAASPLRDKIHWAGLQQDPVPWYQAMDALVIASVNEGLPNAALEGMACGLPLLSNDVCGIREVARPGEHGWIEDFNTVPLLAAGLERFSQLPAEDLAQMGRAAQGHVQREFSLNAMMARYDALYTSVAAI